LRRRAGPAARVPSLVQRGLRRQPRGRSPRSARRRPRGSQAARRRLKRAALFGSFLLLAGRGLAQQPFLSDDAEVTERGKVHFEYANQYVLLQKSFYPNLRQDTNNFVIQYGLFEHVEVNMDFPLIAIVNARGSGMAS